MAQPTDLCLLQDVKGWAYGNGIANAWDTNSDFLLNTYISMASRAILNGINRPNLLLHQVDDMLSGINGTRVMLKEFPVLSIVSFKANGVTIPPRPAFSGGTIISSTLYPGGPVGYVLEPWDGYAPGKQQELVSVGYPLTRGSYNVDVSYMAGYAIMGEAAKIPASTPFTIAPLAPQGPYTQDAGVTFADGTALTAVAQGATPTTGQYVPPAPPPLTTSGTEPDPAKGGPYFPLYTFAAADEGKDILLNYSFVPSDLQYCCMKWVGEWWSYRDRVAQKSKALPQGGGTATFQLVNMPDDLKMVLNQFNRVLPV